MDKDTEKFDQFDKKRIIDNANNNQVNDVVVVAENISVDITNPGVEIDISGFGYGGVIDINGFSNVAIDINDGAVVDLEDNGKSK